jgi:hypothetical protein
VVLLDDSSVVIVALVRLLGNQPMLMVLLPHSRLLWWQARELACLLLELLDEAELTHGVGGFPAGGAMELAWLIKHCIKGVSVLSAPLTDAGSLKPPWSAAIRFELVELLVSASLKSSHGLM